MDPVARELARQQFADAQRAEAVGRVAGRAAHDLNNLLAVVKGYCYLLGPLLTDPEAAELVGGIDGAVADLAGVAERLHALAHRSAGSPRAVRLNDAVVAADAGHLLPAGVALVLDLADDAGWVLADPGRLADAVRHLVANAGEAAPAGDRVTVATRRTVADGKPWAVLTVTDTGSGPPDEVRPHLFAPLFTTKPGRGGVGVGLGVVREVADRAGGRAEAELGGRFVLHLPGVPGPG